MRFVAGSARQPSLITLTANGKWAEVVVHLEPEQDAMNRADVVMRRLTIIVSFKTS